MLTPQSTKSNSVFFLKKKQRIGKFITIFRFLQPKNRMAGPSSAPDCFRANLSCKQESWNFLVNQIISSKETENCTNTKLQTCKNPLKGANPVPGPIMMIGSEELAGSLKFDCLTKIGAQLHSVLSSKGTEFCKKVNFQQLRWEQYYICSVLHIHSMVHAQKREQTNKVRHSLTGMNDHPSNQSILSMHTMN